MTPKKTLTEIFAVVDDEDKILGYFKDMNAVERFFERESIDQAVILTVTRAENAEYPDDPMLEFSDRKLSELVSNYV